jgi:hypothetical protein
MENNTATTLLSPIDSLREAQETGTISVCDPSESGESAGETGRSFSEEALYAVEQTAERNT